MKAKKIMATIPEKYAWIEDMEDLEKLGKIYSKLDAVSFGLYRENPDQPILARELYGFHLILMEICRELAEVIKLDKWSGEVEK